MNDQPIDINVWNSTLYGDHPNPGRVVITGYPMTKNAAGYWDTDTGTILFSIDTDLPPDQWDDSWYGLSEDTTPGDIPAEVLEIVLAFLTRQEEAS